MALIHSNSFIRSSTAMDSGNNDFCLPTDLGTGNYFEWDFDSGAIGFMGSVYPKSRVVSKTDYRVKLRANTLEIALGSTSDLTYFSKVKIQKTSCIYLGFPDWSLIKRE